jgi:hypothetical protein
MIGWQRGLRSAMRVALAMGFVAAAMLVGERTVGAGASTTQSVGTAAAPQLVVSPTGDDQSCARAVGARPCATFGRAYALARCGDIVGVSGGSYGQQLLARDDRKTGCSNPVLLEPLAGAAVTVDKILLGDFFGSGTPGPSGVTVRKMAVTEVSIWTPASEVTLDQIDGGSFVIQGARNVRILGGDWGPCDSSGPSACRTQNFITDDTRLGQVSRDILIDGAVIHDYKITAPEDHFECLYMTGGTNITIRNTRFANCETYAIYLTPRPWAAFRNLVIERNRFGRTCCLGTSDRSSAINFGGTPDSPGVRSTSIRRNSFVPGQGVVQEGGPATAEVAITGNILEHTGCITNVSYGGNFFRTKACAESDRITTVGYVLDGDRLVLAQPEAKALRVAYATLAAGGTPKQAMTAVRRLRPAPRGWTAARLRALIGDPFYLGSVVGPPGAHPAVVGPKVWRKAQQALAR